jgi:hypothetical protein
LAVSIVTAQVLPSQAPPQPANVEAEAGCMVSVTWLPAEKSAAQASPQLMPAGVLVTVPLPVPVLPTVSVNSLPPPPPQAVRKTNSRRPNHLINRI